MRVNSGSDLQALAMGGSVPGKTGSTTSAPTATTATDSGGGWTVNQWAGFIVEMGAVYGVIISNTATVLTVDRWYNPATPGGAAGTTPSTGVYTIAGASPAPFMALTANTGAPAATDTVLTGEITTAGGGLIKKIATYAHTTGAASYTLTATFTGNGSDSYPVTIHKDGIFNSLVASTGIMQFETVLNADATLNISGDAVTITHTVNI